MQVVLNEKQIEGLASFLFDLAKGLILGAIGTIIISSTQIAAIFIGSFSAAICIVIALGLLGRL